MNQRRAFADIAKIDSSRIENSEICGYKPPPKFELYGKLYKSECRGTNLVNIYHDGKGGFYSRLSIQNSLQCGYKEPIKDWKLKIRVVDKKGKKLKSNDNVIVYILKDKSSSSRGLTSLKTRIILSVLLFALLIVGYYMDLIKPNNF